MKILFSLIAAVIITGCSSTLSDNDFVKEKGEEILIDSGNYASLISRYEASLKESESDTLRFKLANAYYLSGDGEAAMFQLSQIDPDSIDVAELSLLRANIYYDRGAYQKSLQYVNMAIRSESKLGEAYNLQGLIAAQQGELDKAKRAFENARVHHYNDAYVKNNLSMVAMLQGNYHEAISILTPLVQSGRADDTAKANLLLAYAKTGKTRAFSNMLSDSESDIHLADKYRSLNAAQPHLNQPSSRQKSESRSTLFNGQATPIETNLENKEQQIDNTGAAKQTLEKKGSLEGISSIERAKLIAVQNTNKKELALKQSVVEQISHEAPAIETNIDADPQRQNAKSTSNNVQIERLKEASTPTEIETVKNGDIPDANPEQTALAKLRAHLTEARNNEIEKTKNESKKKISAPAPKMLLTNLEKQVTKDGFVYIATSDFPLGKVTTLHLKKRRKWVFDIQGAKNFTIKRKRYYKTGPARSIEIGEHNSFIRIVLTARKGVERRPQHRIEGNKLLIQW
ncbi:tetratricopeptide repeat protein [Enterovibrio baiacu]|uniref:tetratricopeptide repeat protein n=1 Tax=Enterovibrio baiacu TaxID=2491023 RepID=UPI001010FF69|nr:tetratricopeptide repeat protein [Enterovibrio baiacu]MBE1276658.1 hypothetical protein [Enterovibrio baiacu]